MTKNPNPRPATADDLTALETLAGQLDLFPPEFLPTMLQESSDGEALLQVLTDDSIALGVSYTKPEALAYGTWNMLALGVDPAQHGTGIGRKMVRDVEVTLKAQGARLLIVDTSSTSAFDGARAFYAALGYGEEARIADYWGDGDAKVTFTKRLA